MSDRTTIEKRRLRIMGGSHREAESASGGAIVPEETPRGKGLFQRQRLPHQHRCKEKNQYSRDALGDATRRESLGAA